MPKPTEPYRPDPEGFDPCSTPAARELPISESADPAVAVAQGETPVTQMLQIDDITYVVTPADALKISGAFMLAINGAETAVALESSQVLTVTPANALEIAQQLAGV